MGAEHSLDRVIDTLSARFPALGRDTVADCVFATHARLQRNATIDSHLTALTQRQAGEALALRGGGPESVSGPI